MERETSSSLLKPEILGQLHSLDVAARVVVDGVHAGVHRSPYRGHSTDFADHRPYVAGDDIRHLDWKVLARRDRLVLKRYEAETDLGCILAVDGSGSMAYRGERAALTKYRYASVLAASLAYLVLLQGDRVGLQLFHETAVRELKPSRQDQLDRICHALESHAPQAGTDAGKGLARLAMPDCRRGLVVLITDGLAAVEEYAQVVRSLRHRGHDLAILWVLDPDETDLAVATVSRFSGLEGEADIVAEPKALRQAYQDVVADHRLRLQRACCARNVILIETDTARPPHVALNNLLAALEHQGVG
jgi:uncharacterized protein (DUF58 family)